ncbi:MAG: CPBP family intramembrane glutamic endopeptidase [Planctomycetota bacterium]
MPPGPGLPEALGWCLGYFLTCQLLLAIPAVIAVRLLGEAALGREPTKPETMVAVTGVMQVLSVGVTLAAFRLRCGRLGKLQFGLPSLPATVAALYSLPAAVAACSMWGFAAGAAWRALCEAAPGLEVLDDMSSLSAVGSMMETVPLPILLLTVAVCPAVVEELFCRGLIGRGVVARWGVWPGVLLTSILFCGLHLHPAHAAALLPIAVLMHVSYLASRSLWLPIGLHFANNAFAVCMQKFTLSETGELPDPHAAHPLTESPWLLAALWVGTTAVAAIGIWAVWSVRVRFVEWDADGRPGGELSSRWPTVEPPPASADAAATVRWELPPLVAFAVTVIPLAALMAISLISALVFGLPG